MFRQRDVGQIDIEIEKKAQAELNKPVTSKFSDALKKAMRDTYVDPVISSHGTKRDSARNITTGFFGFRRADYSGAKGAALIAWDILTWIPTVAVNTVALFTEVLPLTFKNLGRTERDLVATRNDAKNSLGKKNPDIETGRGYKLAYWGGSIFYYVGRAITSPSKNIQDSFTDWKKMTTGEKVAAVFKGIGSAILTSVAYTFLFPVIVAGIVATPALTVFGATIIGGGYLLGHGLTALASIPVIGPAVKGLGAAILKGLNSIPGVNGFVNWLVPTKPPLTIIPGDPVATYQYNMQVKAALEAKAEFIKAEVGTGFLSGVVASARGIISTAVKGLRSLFGSSETDSKPENKNSNVKIVSLDAAFARLIKQQEEEKTGVTSEKNLTDIDLTNDNSIHQVPPGETDYDSGEDSVSDFTQLTAADHSIQLPKQTQPAKNEKNWLQSCFSFFFKTDSKKENLTHPQQLLKK